MIDPAVGHWSHRIPHSFGLVADTLTTPAVSGRAKQIAAENDLNGSLFDTQANRRAFLVAGSQGRLAGWTKASDDRVIAISIVLAGGENTVAIVAPSLIRQEIDPKIPTGFVLIAKDIAPSEWRGGKVSVQLATHGLVEYAIADLVLGRVAVRKIDNVVVGLGVDVLATPSTSEPWVWRLQACWERLFYVTLRWAHWGLGLFLLTLGYRVWSRRGSDNQIAIIFFFAGMILLRLCFFAVLDATSWPGNQPRYLYPIMPLHVSLITLVDAHLVRIAMGGARSLFHFLAKWKMKRAKTLDESIARTL